MKHTKDSILKLLETNDRAVERAVVAIFNYQTASEQNAEHTLDHNGVGFSGAHGEIGASMAKQYLKRGFLTPKQIDYWKRSTNSGRMRIGMYAGQLAKIANGELEQV